MRLRMYAPFVSTAVCVVMLPICASALAAPSSFACQQLKAPATLSNVNDAVRKADEDYIRSASEPVGQMTSADFDLSSIGAVTAIGKISSTELAALDDALAKLENDLRFIEKGKQLQQQPNDAELSLFIGDVRAVKNAYDIAVSSCS